MTIEADGLWGVLANVSGGDWTKQSQEWQDAAARARDQYFAALRTREEGGNMRTIWVLIWRDGPEDGKERYVLTPQQRGAPTQSGKWVLLGEAVFPESILTAAFDTVQDLQKKEVEHASDKRTAI